MSRCVLVTAGASGSGGEIVRAMGSTDGLLFDFTLASFKENCLCNVSGDKVIESLRVAYAGVLVCNLLISLSIKAHAERLARETGNAVTMEDIIAERGRSRHAALKGCGFAELKLRENGNRQVCFFLNPKTAVTL